jgi:hypothetical protein
LSLALSLLLSGLCLFGSPAPWQEEVERLEGQSVEVTALGYQILDIAGEGAPHVGCVRRVGNSLYLETTSDRWRLTGPLAIPRIAGPNYKVWVIGEPTPAKTLPARRLGILATPDRSTCGAAPVASAP